MSINRRKFIQGGITVGSILSLSGYGCKIEDGIDTQKDAEVTGPPFQLDEITISELRDQIAAGELSCRAVTEMYLQQIDALNMKGPRLYAVLETNPDAIEIAEQLDNELQESGPRGALHGIPILLKDNVDTSDRMTTTAGSTALQGSIPLQDSFVAQRLREAGAVLLGKANMSEWAGWKSFERGTPGWSGRGWNGGQGDFCRNPYALDRVPGGSSSGSGVAVAANLAAAAIGSETDGSIVGPSSRNGLVGIKPTIGLVSRGGVIPISSSQDSTGPMTRTVTDAAIILGTLTGIDPRDEKTSASEGNFIADYTVSLDPAGLNGARIGVARDYAGFDVRVDKLFEEALEVMRAQGATVIDPITLPSQLRFGNEYEMEVLYHEFKADLNLYLASLGPEAPIKSLAELIAYNEANADLELSLFGQELLVGSEERGPLTDQKYINALQTSHRLSRNEGIDQVMDAENLDAIVGPTSGPASLMDPLGGNTAGSGGGCSTPSAMAGYPNMTVPMGFIYGLPVGISLFGRAWSEKTLLRLAYAYEQATNHRIPPRFLSTMDVRMGT